ncbi:11.1kd protein [Maize streak virus - A[Bambui]]|nr:11.1kd protein [Maize streak virus - A[Bambui]]
MEGEPGAVSSLRGETAMVVQHGDRRADWFGHSSLECKLEALQAQHLLPQVHERVGSENAVEECNGRRSWCHPERSVVHGHCPRQWSYIYCPWADPSVL